MNNHHEKHCWLVTGWYLNYVTFRSSKKASNTKQTDVKIMHERSYLPFNTCYILDTIHRICILFVYFFWLTQGHEHSTCQLLYRFTFLLCSPSLVLGNIDLNLQLHMSLLLLNHMTWEYSCEPKMSLCCWILILTKSYFSWFRFSMFLNWLFGEFEIWKNINFLKHVAN